MSKSKTCIENALNLPTKEELDDILGIEQEVEEDGEQLPESKYDLNELQSSLSMLKQMRIQLKDIPDISKRKEMLSKIADRAEQAFEEVYEHAFFSVEPKFMASLIKAATELLKVATDSHAKVLNSDITLIEMQMKKEKIEFDMSNTLQAPSSPSNSLKNDDDGEEYITCNRNDILKK